MFANVIKELEMRSSGLRWVLNLMISPEKGREVEERGVSTNTGKARRRLM